MIIQFLTSGSTKEYSDNIVYLSERYTSYVKDILINESQIEKGDIIHSLFSQPKGKHILGRGIKLACILNKNILFKNYDVKSFVKNINLEKCDYLFSTPSFLWNFKDIINFNKIKKIQLSGEFISSYLENYFLNEFKNKIIINHYGSSETFGIGYGLLGQNLKIIKNGKIEQKKDVFYFTSPYTRNRNAEKLNDIVLLEKNEFKIIGRNNLSFIKKNGKKINLLFLRQILLNLKIIDLSFEIVNNIFDDFNLYVISDLNENEIRKEIYSKLGNEYQPIKIIYTDKYKKTNNKIKYKLF
jgi:hypothetical protein